MSRPPVSVVVPFAGDASQAQAALVMLRALHTGLGDELILADNSGVAPGDIVGVTVVRANAERSPAHARNAGAALARADWILFLDADTRAPADLLDAYFAEPVAPTVGALAGEVIAAPGGASLAERYGAARSFLSQRAHLAHPYLPRAVAANLLVRRAAFEQLGGFLEGVRAAEDTDFSWRLQRAGWLLELRPGASVEHRYRASVGELRLQWRGYAAGRAWLARRYADFQPESAVRRGLRRAVGRVVGRKDARRDARPAAGVTPAGALPPRRLRGGRVERAEFLALDLLLAAEELAGFALSNRPSRGAAGGTHGGPRGRGERGQSQVVVVAGAFPEPGDPLVEFAWTLASARVEAVARPAAPAVGEARRLRIDYREDDGAAGRVLALVALAVRHPGRCLSDLITRRASPGPSLVALAPAVRRLERDTDASVYALGGQDAARVAKRLAALAGRGLHDPRAA